MGHLEEAKNLTNLELMILAAITAHNEATVQRVLGRELKSRKKAHGAVNAAQDLLERLEEEGDPLAEMVGKVVNRVQIELASDFIADSTELMAEIWEVKEAAAALRKDGRDEDAAVLDNLVISLERVLQKHEEILHEDHYGNRPETFDLTKFIAAEKRSKKDLKKAGTTADRVKEMLADTLAQEQAKHHVHSSSQARKDRELMAQVAGISDKIAETIEHGRMMLDPSE